MQRNTQITLSACLCEMGPVDASLGVGCAVCSEGEERAQHPPTGAHDGNRGRIRGS